MRTATLQRFETSDAGTFGVLTTDNGLRLHVGEPPWRNNAKGISCVPPGTYRCYWHKSPRFGWVYKLSDTAPRTEVLIHKGNWVGDKAMGMRADSQGCLIPGLSRARLDSQAAVAQSGEAVTRLADHFDRQDFLLTILPITAGANP